MARLGTRTVGWLALLLVVSANAARAEESGGRIIRLDETVISGNQELPKVLYIVPWKDPSGIPSIELNPEFTESEVFRSLYPPAYKRELNYYELLDAAKTEE